MEPFSSLVSAGGLNDSFSAVVVSGRRMRRSPRRSNTVTMLYLEKVNVWESLVGEQILHIVTHTTRYQVHSTTIVPAKKSIRLFHSATFWESCSQRLPELNHYKKIHNGLGPTRHLASASIDIPRVQGGVPWFALGSSCFCRLLCD